MRNAGAVTFYGAVSVRVGVSNMMNEAFSNVEAAVAAEKACKHRLAFEHYSQSVRLFLRDVEKLPDEKARGFIRNKCAELMGKAEKMYLYATKTHTTTEGLQTRLEMLDGPDRFKPEQTPQDFEQRLKALYGPPSVMGMLKAKAFEQTQQVRKQEDSDVGGFCVLFDNRIDGDRGCLSVTFVGLGCGTGLARWTRWEWRR